MASAEQKAATAQRVEDLTRQNIETIAKIEAATHASRSASDVVADAIAGFCGSVTFIWVHVLWFGFWLTWNSLPQIPKHFQFDRPPFPVLTLAVSLEAIFLSTFILISQNRQQKLADQRNHLDLQINLLAEQETSQIISMMQLMMTHLGIKVAHQAVALQETTNPEKVVEQMEEILDPSETGK